MIGQTLSHFRITAKLGEGGMGEVYRAEDTKLGREVAIKVLPSELASDPERRKRFEREAKAVAALNHPNIVTVYSIEEDAGVHFIAMELVDGKVFSELIPRDGFSASKLLQYAIPVADAVATAHRKGITHRDLKPDNLMLDEEGRVKVMDFGLAKLEEGSITAAGGTELRTESVTEEGKILGTVAYMSPEQAEGKPVDARSDVFSLGVVLYEMATGRRPFEGDTSISTITAILRDQPDSVTELNPRLPRHLGRVIRRAMAKEPDRRYQTALDLRNELEELDREMRTGELEVDPSAIAETPMEQKKSRLVPILGGLVALLLFAVGYLAFRGDRDPTSRADGPVAEEPGVALQIRRLTNTGDSSAAAISPDGKRVVHVVDHAGEQSLWLRQVSTESNVQIVPPAAVRYRMLAFSTDGESIYFSRQLVGSEITTGLFHIPVLGGQETLIAHGIGAFSLSPDGSRLAYYLFDEETPADVHLAVSNTDGTEQQILVTKSRPQEILTGKPSWSPSGGTIVFGSGSIADGFVAWLEQIEIDSGEVSRLGDREWSAVHDLDWLSDGSALLMEGSYQMFTSRQLWWIGYPGGSPRRITNDLNNYNSVSLSADGVSLVSVVTESQSDLWRIDTSDEGQSLRLGNWTGSENGAFGLAPTPDGRIVFTAGSASGAVHLWVANPDGTALRRLTSGDRVEMLPSVCGDAVIFNSSSEGRFVSLWRVGLDGSGLAPLTKDALDYFPTCSAESPWLYFASWRSAPPSVWKQPIDGGSAERVTGDDVLYQRHPALSPDGRILAVETALPGMGQPEYWIEDLKSGEKILEIPVHDSAELAWHPDGDAVAVSRIDKGVENLWRYPLDGGDPEQLTFFEDQEIWSAVWLPDGKTIILSRGTESSDVVLLTDFQ